MRVFVLLASACIALGLLAWALVTPFLKWQLHSASNALEVQVAIRNLSEVSGQTGFDIVEEFASHRADVAFDRELGGLLIYDATDNTVITDSIAPPVSPNTGDPGLDEAILAAMPRTVTKLHMRPGKFEAIRVVEDERGRFYVFDTDSTETTMAMCFQVGTNVIFDVDPLTHQRVTYSRTAETPIEQKEETESR